MIFSESQYPLFGTMLMPSELASLPQRLLRCNRNAQNGE